jgi:3-deoxy-manno-octulosonate cytidylyltransferase (CMP-KDO synthetase)
VGKLGPEFETVVNVQGDEPDITAEVLDRMIKRLHDDDEAAMSTLATHFAHRGEVLDPNKVKVVLDGDGRAIYFSRHAIPFGRDLTDNLAELESYLWHLGVYAYRRDFLLEFASWPPTPLEKTEKLEQLRALEHGRKIAVEVVDYRGCGIDTPDEYEEFVRKYCSKTG